MYNLYATIAVPVRSGIDGDPPFRYYDEREQIELAKAFLKESADIRYTFYEHDFYVCAERVLCHTRCVTVEVWIGAPLKENE